MPYKLKAVEWLCFGSNAFNVPLPLYTSTDKMPKYVSETTETVDTKSFYWASRMFGALSDAHKSTSVMYIERYQNAVSAKSHELLNKYDEEMSKSGDFSKIDEANQSFSDMVEEETNKALKNVLLDACAHMKNNYARSDN